MSISVFREEKYKESREESAGLNLNINKLEEEA